MAELRDARGCLTDAGLASLARAAIGQAPGELAAHVAGCGRCQERMLAADRPEPGERKKANPPPAWRLWAVLGAILFLLVSILFTASRLR